MYAQSRLPQTWYLDRVQRLTRASSVYSRWFVVLKAVDFDKTYTDIPIESISRPSAFGSAVNFTKAYRKKGQPSREWVVSPPGTRQYI